MGLLTAALVLATAAFSYPAAAIEIPLCDTRAAHAARLARDFGEVPVARALTADGFMVEIFASPTGEWTAISIHPDGPACITTSGNSWHVLPNNNEIGISR